jgi:hypothetical protein
MCLLVCAWWYDLFELAVVALAIKRQEYQAKKALESQFEGADMANRGGTLRMRVQTKTTDVDRRMSET